MHTIDVLEMALGLARQAGYQIRQEWLGGGGGACEIRGVKWLFLDLALTPQEQLEAVLDVLRSLPQLAEMNMPPALRALLGAPATPRHLGRVA